MNNSQSTYRDGQESAADERLPYQAPQLLEISLVEGRVVLGVCKTGTGSRSGSGSSNCYVGGIPGTPCNTIQTGS